MQLYQFLGGSKKEIETDLTIGIDKPGNMAAKAREYKKNGVRMITIKLGKSMSDDIECVKEIRMAVGDDLLLRTDANQCWSFDTAVFVLQEIAKYNIQFCEQPMRSWDDYKFPELRKLSPIKIMADESIFPSRCRTIDKSRSP